MTQFVDIPADEVETVAEQLSNTVERTDYNAIAKYYNTKAVGAMFHFEFPKTKISSLKKQLEMRGLIINADVTAGAAPISEEEGAPTHAFVRRLTDKEAAIITVKVGRKKKEGGEGGSEKKDAGGKPAKGAVSTGKKK
jgi:hypothetical protein